MIMKWKIVHLIIMIGKNGMTNFIERKKFNVS
jgi:hypothetical protein